MNLVSTGCQPVLFASLPKSSSNVHREAFLDSAGVVAKLPDDNRLAACAPQEPVLRANGCYAIRLRYVSSPLARIRDSAWQ
jgi:hypothetical protein